MTKVDLVTDLLESSGGKLTKLEADDCIDSLLSLMSSSLLKGEYVRLTGIGSLLLVKRAPRKGVNIQTGEAISIPSRTRVKLLTSSILKRKLARRDGV